MRMPTLTLGGETLPRVTLCAGRRLEWQESPLGLSVYVSGGHAMAVSSDGGWAYGNQTGEADCNLSGTEPTAALAQRRCVAVLEALVKKIEVEA